jgi:hypothetical protein
MPPTPASAPALGRIPAPPQCDLPTPPPRDDGRAACSIQGSRGQDAPPAPAPAQSVSLPSQPPVAPPVRRISSMLPSPFPFLQFLKAHLARVFTFNSRSPAHDSRPRAQAELALEKVTVLRNDLSEADLVVVTVERKAENPEAAHSAGGQPAKPARRPSARWIQLKGEPAPGDSGPVPRHSDQLVEMRP